MSLQAVIAPTGTLRYAFVAAAQRASLTGTTNPVTVVLTVGADTGTTWVQSPRSTHPYVPTKEG